MSRNFNGYDGNDFEDACEAGDIIKVREIISGGFTDVNCGISPACIEGHRDILNILIANGANDWNEGLRGAAIGGHLDIVNFMIDSGATDLDSALDVARNLEVARLLVEKGANPTKGLTNAWNEVRSKDMVIFLLNSGADMSGLYLIAGQSFSF